jgi:type II secretory pathway predicted ATPase ExeA
MECFNQVSDPFTDNFVPELFYGSQSLIDKIEDAVRHKSGLSIVTGATGTGKSALCNYLVNRFSRVDNKILTYIIKKPFCLSKPAFISLIAQVFGLSLPQDKDVENLQQLIRNYIVNKSGEGYLLVLMIDDGQQLQRFCLEYLCELLTIEKSGNKHLQIIIFGQCSLEQRLTAIHGLTNRIKAHCRLNPLGFKETRELIRFRIKHAADNINTPILFTDMGIAAIFLATSGVQGKIINLCHRLEISMFTKKSNIAGWFFVKNLIYNDNKSIRAKRVKNNSLTYVLASIIIFAAIILTGSLTPVNNTATQALTLINPETVTQQAINLPANAASKQDENIVFDNKSTVSVLPLTSNIETNEIMGLLTEDKEMSVWTKIGILFNNNVDRAFINRLIAINSHIKDFDHLKAGDFLKIPFKPSTYDVKADNKIRVKIQSFDTLDGAVKFVADYPDIYPSVKIFPYINKMNKKVYDVILDDNFSSKDEADSIINNTLSGRYAMSAQIIDTMDDITYCYKIWVN